MRNAGRNLNRSTSDIREGSLNNTLYTYIGMSEPEREKAHFYENQSIITAQKRSEDFDQPDRVSSRSLWSNERRWTCRQCSFAYNDINAGKCDICKCLRTPPSLNQPSTITVTQDRTAKSNGL